MNTFLKILALVLTAAVPVAFSIESAGVALPTVINTGHVFYAFVFTLMLLTIGTDYRSQKPLKIEVSSVSPVPVASRSTLRLAA